MPADDRTFWEKLQGRRSNDINLPAETGKMDPRLLPYHPIEAVKATKEKLYDTPMSTLDTVINGLKKAK